MNGQGIADLWTTLVEPACEAASGLWTTLREPTCEDVVYTSAAVA